MRIKIRSAAVLAAVFAGEGAWAQTNPITKGAITIALKPYVTVPSGNGAPQDLVPANDGSGRTFIATRNGNILVASGTGSLSGTPFLNMASAGVSLFLAGEGGFPGLAFSPGYAATGTAGYGKFYTFTTETYAAANGADFSHPEMKPAGSLTPSNQIVIREWTANPATNVVSTTSRVLMRINHPQNNHQGGSLHFGPDGDLYIGLGDGGGGNDENGSANAVDGHTNSTGNAQDTSVVFGKVLRIDPRGSNSANGQYGIPTNNPFVGQSGKVAEIYAYGLRNPYRMGFDTATGSLYAGDVGQDNREEVDVITNGGNFGWVFREGTRDNSGSTGRTTPTGFTSIAPIAEYTHSDGDAVQGGFVYRGSAIPSLFGKYVFGDYQGTTATSGGLGRLFYTDAAGGPIFEFNLNLALGVAVPSPLFGFGRDESGELYALFSNGAVEKLVTVPEAGGLAYLALPGCLLRRRRRA